MSDKPTKVLVCDDSSTVRRIIRRVLRDAQDIEVVGEASDGSEVLALIQSLKPDLLTLDIEMPQQDGLSTLSQLKRAGVKMPIIMISTLTHRGAAITLEALHRGASDYIAKPSQVGSLNDALELVRAQLVPRIRALTTAKSPKPAPQAKPPAPPTRAPAPQGARRSSTAPLEADKRAPIAIITPPSQRAAKRKMWRGLTPVPTPGQINQSARPAAPTSAASISAPAPKRTSPPVRSVRRPGHYKVLCIAVSTGGPNAITQLMSALPKDFPLPILVVQHMPAPFTQLLAERLDDRCPLTVREGYAGGEVTRGAVWIAPGGFHMIPKKNEKGVILAINEDPPENSCRPAADPMFRAAVDVYGGNVLGLVMTGMGHDGLDGSRHVKAAGGTIIAQDEASSVVWGMPGAVVQADLADGVYPLDQLARTLCTLAGMGQQAGPTVGLPPSVETAGQG